MKYIQLTGFAVLMLWILSLLFSGCKEDNLSDLTGDGHGTSVCDTSFEVSYQNDIVTILRFSKNSSVPSCYYCHSQTTSGLGGGHVLDNYSSLKIYVNNDQLICAIRQTGCANAEPMPSGGGKLSDCDIARVERWVNAGAPNN